MEEPYKKIEIPTLIKFFRQCEEKFEVGNWKLNGIHVWPVIRIIIYFSLYRTPIKYKKNNSWLNRIKQKQKLIIKLLIAKYRLWSIALKKTDYLFAGAPTHREKYNGKLLNKYFDPMLDHLQEKGQGGYLLEYMPFDKSKVYKSSRVIGLASFRPLFKNKKKNQEEESLWDDLNFQSFLVELEDITGINKNKLQHSLKGRINNILNWANLFKFFLEKMEVKYAFGLCYYSDAMYGLNFAANKLGVKTFDMQHGLQGYLHPAYFFENVPRDGYNILPSIFWVWDDSSYKNIKNWSHNSQHKALLGGNPWLNYLNSKSQSEFHIDDSRPLILFTLQPLEPLFSNYLIEVIKKSYKKFNWFLRLHPRMTYEENNRIFGLLKKENLMDVVNVKDACNMPLPILLNRCQLHISKSSGSIVEAALMHRYSLIIDELGINSYKDLIAEGLAFSCLTKNPNEFLGIIDKVLKLEVKSDMEMTKYNYTTILDQINSCKNDGIISS